ncbi:hypothetical protein PR048_033471 [Dryococelus australis]|uniref:Uncharacterized protein n=1 Tax=Dryococelus australis TaxID=614101 RepID=A0ABQ9G3P0_9NEOP|nr:hypothetical protein PR048_033471 [Dryococelus australis]
MWWKDKKWLLENTVTKRTTSLPSRATLAERLACSPPTKVNRVQFSAGSPDFRRCKSWRTMSLVGGFSRESPVSPARSSSETVGMSRTAASRATKMASVAIAICQNATRQTAHCNTSRYAGGTPANGESLAERCSQSDTRPVPIPSRNHSENRYTHSKEIVTHCYIPTPGWLIRVHEATPEFLCIFLQTTFANPKSADTCGGSCRLGGGSSPNARTLKRIVNCLAPFPEFTQLGTATPSVSVLPCTSSLLGTTVAERLACSPPTKASRVTPDFCMWESCSGRCHWSAGGFLGDLPRFPRYFISITLIGSQDLDVKSHPNLFTHFIFVQCQWLGDSTSNARVRASCLLQDAVSLTYCLPYLRVGCYDVAQLLGTSSQR